MPATLSEPQSRFYDSHSQLELNGFNSASQQSLHTPGSIYPSQATFMTGTEHAEKDLARDEHLLTGVRLALVFTAMLLSLLLIALDETILAVALPSLSSDFNSFDLQGWISASFPLAQTVFTLFYGQLLPIFPAKWILASSITFFEAGSLICAIAHSAEQVVAGRIVSGFGAAGMYVSMIQIISQATRLEDRPRLFGLFGAVFGLSSVVGPLIGGAFTDNASLTWRWCFYLNLPVGGVSVLGVMFLVKAVPPLGSDPRKRTMSHIIQQTLALDYFGTVLIAGALTSLQLALQWGGTLKPWGDKAVIISFVFFGVLSAVYVVWEIYLGDRAMTPTEIFKSRSIWAILVYSFLGRFALFLYSFYLPLFYQAVHHHTATKSGLDLLPFMLAIIILVIISGQIVGMTGRYWPWLLAGPVLLAVGAGLLYTVNQSTPNSHIIGFQILSGAGVGLGLQNIILAIQTEFDDAPHILGQATSMVSFSQFFGGTVVLGMAQPILSAELDKFLAKYAPEAPALVIKMNPVAIYSLPAEMIPNVLKAYSSALDVVFMLGVPCAGISLLATLLIKNMKIEKTAMMAA
ncbi:major facilitator transporter-like protein [Favolaschia claudopus]|uniref:Major facilitator transporter-like protein n=1 Tax=Favolaschia claudopus TaxID=2862362 RepID=A0AAW0DBV2_9AGAR